MKISFLHFRAGLILIVFCAVFFLSAQATNAAQFYFGARQNAFTKGQPFEVGVFVDTEGEKINALEGKIQFSPAELELQDIRDGGTSVNFWAQKPESKTCAEVCEIAFSGIIPGGYVGRAYLFTATFKAKITGKISIAIDSERVLLHDGAGTPAAVKKSPLVLEIGELSSAAETPATPVDNQPPEPFIPEITSDPNIFDGDYFLVFNTQDKGVGMDHYEVKEEGFFAGWFHEESSPYRLRNQSLGGDIAVKAVDKANNERVVIVPAQKRHAWYQQRLLWAIMAAVLSLVGGLWIKLRKKYRKD